MGDPPRPQRSPVLEHAAAENHSVIFLQASFLLSHCLSDPKANPSVPLVPQVLKPAADHAPEKQNSRAYSIPGGKHSPARCRSHTMQVSEILVTQAHFSSDTQCTKSSLQQLIFCTQKQRSLQFRHFLTQTHHAPPKKQKTASKATHTI